MQHLTESERAYRRGALQAIQFAKEFLFREEFKTTTERCRERLARLEQALIKGRVSGNPKYLGTYMDTVMKELKDG